MALAAAALAIVGALAQPAWAEGPSSPPIVAPEDRPTIASLRATYAAPPSKFVMVDGVDLHVRDEGSGPVVVLLNGHFGNLHMFDSWTRSLVKAGFRVVRLDWPPYGLSLPDPTGVYSTDRATQLLTDLLRSLHFRRVSLVGTSNGATVAAHYAAEWPERVDRLAVSTLPLGKPGPRTTPDDLKRQLALYGKSDYRPETYYRALLRDLFFDPEKVTPEMVRLYTDLNNYPGGYAAVDNYIQHNLAMYDKGDFVDLYKKVRAPVLVQWGDAGRVLPPSAAEAAARAFPNAKSMRVIHYAHSGHIPMLEEPDRTVEDLIAFLKGS